MLGCVLSQLKPSELYILSFGLSLFTAKSVDLLGLYPIRKLVSGLSYVHCGIGMRKRVYINSHDKRVSQNNKNRMMYK